MFKRKGGGESKAFWTMLKKTALFLSDGFPKWDQIGPLLQYMRRAFLIYCKAKMDRGKCQEGRESNGWWATSPRARFPGKIGTSPRPATRQPLAFVPQDGSPADWADEEHFKKKMRILRAWEKFQFLLSAGQIAS